MRKFLPAVLSFIFASLSSFMSFADIKINKVRNGTENINNNDEINTVSTSNTQNTKKILDKTNETQISPDDSAVSECQNKNPNHRNCPYYAMKKITGDNCQS